MCAFFLNTSEKNHLNVLKSATLIPVLTLMILKRFILQLYSLRVQRAAPLATVTVGWKLMCQRSIMYVRCWQRRRLIDIIDVAGWQGDCNNRHYTVVANSREIALNQLALPRRGQHEWSLNVTLEIKSVRQACRYWRMLYPDSSSYPQRLVWLVSYAQIWPKQVYRLLRQFSIAKSFP